MIPYRSRKRVYLDYAAAAPVSKAAHMAFTRALTVWGNPASPHTEGRAAHTMLEDARTRIARLAEVKADAVLFTGNATEANALAIEGHIHALAQKGASYTDMHVLYMAGSHSSVTHAVRRIEHLGVQAEVLPLTEGAPDLSALKALLRRTTVLVVVDAVCGETGTMYAVRDVRRVLAAQKSAALLHVDGSQMPYSFPFELTRLGADTLALDAQKVGGVRGIGALIAPRKLSLAPLYEGGGQERGLRAGTPSHALAVAFATALEEAHAERSARRARFEAMRTHLIQKITVLPDVYTNEGAVHDPRIVNLSFVGRDTDYLVALLDEAGFAVSTRSACETDSDGSRAVRALTGDDARARATLRISWGPETHVCDIERFARVLVSRVNFLDAAGIL